MGTMCYPVYDQSNVLYRINSHHLYVVRAHLYAICRNALHQFTYHLLYVIMSMLILLHTSFVYFHNWSCHCKVHLLYCRYPKLQILLLLLQRENMQNEPSVTKVMCGAASRVEEQLTSPQRSHSAHHRHPRLREMPLKHAEGRQRLLPLTLQFRVNS